MPSVYDGDAFETRVNYAASVISKGKIVYNARCFDTCFEMNDGDYVAAALWRRVLKNPTSKLAANLFRFIGQERAMESYEKLKDIPRHELAEAAREHRAKCHRELNEFMEKQRQAQG